MDINARLAALEAEIKALPAGNISWKTIRGKVRMYLQWSENGKVKNKYIKLADQARVKEQLARRDALIQEYAALREGQLFEIKTNLQFLTHVKTGAVLEASCAKVRQYKKRICFTLLHKYLEADIMGRVCLLYGLRRTGKTTMLFQAIAELPKEKTAYIKIMPQDNMDLLNHDLQLLQKQGVQYVFIDEVTLMDDFISAASLLSDVYAMFGMKIVLSGTDSLGFAIAEEEELYDRCLTIHTTFIPFREYTRLLDIRDIDVYIRYGGTFRMGETVFDDPELQQEEVSFRDDESTRRYIDTAIARNIQHSLVCYNDGDHFLHLLDLYENHELTNAINRIIEDMNHRFLLSVLTQNFKSHDLGSITQIERKEAAGKQQPSILAKIDKAAVTNKLMQILDIHNQDELSVKLTASHVTEIKAYLKRLELICDFSAVFLDASKETSNVLFTQPGMRYCQAQALVYALMQDKFFSSYDVVQREAICERLLEEVRGRMLEEIVLLETMKAAPKHWRVFKLYFDVGEFDMVIFDRKTLTCKIFEIKHTDNIFAEQYKSLVDVEKCQRTEFAYGTIQEKVVLYRGTNKDIEGIHYRNVVEYLETLGEKV